MNKIFLKKFLLACICSGLLIHLQVVSMKDEVEPSRPELEDILRQRDLLKKDQEFLKKQRQETEDLELAVEEKSKSINNIKSDSEKDKAWASIAALEKQTEENQKILREKASIELTLLRESLKMQMRYSPTFRDRMKESAIQGIEEIPVALTKSVIDLAFEELAIRAGIGAKGRLVQAQIEKEKAEADAIRATKLAQRVEIARTSKDSAALHQASLNNYLELALLNKELLKKNPELQQDLEAYTALLYKEKQN